MQCFWQTTHTMKFWQRWVSHEKAIEYFECTVRRVLQNAYDHSEHTQDFTLHWMEAILSSLIYILYTSTELNNNMCCNWLNVPGGSRHLTQWWSLFFLADADSAITAHTITTPHSAQQGVELKFHLKPSQKRKKIWIEEILCGGVLSCHIRK